MKIDLLVADDHPTVLVGVLHEISRVPSFNVIGTANNSTEIVETLKSSHCDILVTDYSMPGGEFGDGLMLLAFLARRFPDVKVVAFTMMDNIAMVQEMRKAGIRAIVSKRDEARHLITAINEVYAGAEYFSPSVSNVLGVKQNPHSVVESPVDRLSPKELEFLRLFASGYSVGQIADNLHRSKQTISGQKVSVKRKLGLTRDADLFRYAFDSGLVMGREGRQDADVAGAGGTGGEEAPAAESDE
ncbi:response regulator transcription factor [Paraburkholderia acidipaludis]|uniref:response regulator transcription factor n=1 Tax=Paraburkholderia acidipaludis TaxID=660537 RepID=UPI0005BB1560|nr:response regulator transcription factor [Paraburkholderia acidipaludis]